MHSETALGFRCLSFRLGFRFQIVLDMGFRRLGLGSGKRFFFTWGVSQNAEGLFEVLA